MLIKILNYLRTIFILRLKSIKYGKLPYFSGMPILTNNGKFNVGDNFQMTNTQFKCQITCSKDAELIIGDFSYIGQGSNIYSSKSIRIGNNVVISDSVIIHDNNFHLVEHGRLLVKPITIENNVWIGIRSIILPGVTIGENSVIAAGSVVTKSVPSNSLIGGSPAKLIKKLDPEKIPNRR